MSSPKKAVELSKAVLNVTTYTTLPGNDFAEARRDVSIDITDLLKNNGVDSVYQINGVSSIEKDGLTEPETEDGNLNTMLAISGPELSVLEKRVYDVIDAAIVNEKQGKAIRRLIGSKFDDFRSSHWEPIKACEFVKEYYDYLLDKELNK